MRKAWLGLLLVVWPHASSFAADIVVLPFVNFTGKHAAFVSVLPELYEQFESHGLSVIRHDEIRPLLRQHRIRSLGRIGRADARLLREETGARFAVLGSVDLFQPDTSMEVSVSARVLDLERLELLTAVSVGLSSQETQRWFATGRAEDVATVMKQVVARLVTALEPDLRLPLRSREQYHTCGLVAVVPLDDYSNRRYAAEILQNLLMSELVTQDWAVVEPGFVQEILLDEQTVARGGVTDRVRQILRERLGVCWVVTGDLETFEVTASGQDTSVPSLVFGLRLIDARRPGLLASVEVARSGSDTEGLFRRGREYSMARLARTSMEEVVEWIRREGDR